MSIFLTQLFQDNFTRANENPLNPTNWANNGNGYGMKIVSDLCVVQYHFFNSYEFCIGATAPNDQYASATLANLEFNSGGELVLGVRTVANSSVFGTGYLLEVINQGSGWGGSSSGNAYLYAYSGGGGFTSLGSATALTLNPNDIWTLAVVGTTLYVLQNGVQRLSVTDATYSSGQLGLGANSNGTDTISNFVMGSASTTPPAPADIGSGPSILATMHGMRG